MKKIYWIIPLAIIILYLAWYLISPAFITVEMDESISSEATTLSSSPFIAADHDVAGTALIVEQDGKKYIRFENFETINGPNLHIYLASDLDANDFIDLGPIKATKGNVNYEIPEGTDLEKYNQVLIWCVPFKVLFSYSDLS